MVGSVAAIGGTRGKSILPADHLVATEWAEIHVMAHDGEWPRSWDALRQYPAPPSFPGADPEALIEAVQSYVDIDFQADCSIIPRIFYAP